MEEARSENRPDKRSRRTDDASVAAASYDTVRFNGEIQKVKAKMDSISETIVDKMVMLQTDRSKNKRKKGARWQEEIGSMRQERQYMQDHVDYLNAEMLMGRPFYPGHHQWKESEKP